MVTPCLTSECATLYDAMGGQLFHFGLEEARRARRRLARFVRETPLLESHDTAGLFYKAESLQLTGSFKIRTALHQLLRLDTTERARGVVASSSGNFAQGVALAARLLGVGATIVMMRSSNPLKVQRTREYGAKVVFCEDRFQARQEEVARLGRAEGLVEVHPYDHPAGILGNATIGLEIAEQLPAARQVVVPISGGGLIAGVAAAIKAARPRTQVWGVQPERSNAAYLSFTRKEACTIEQSDTIADGLRVVRPGATTFPIILSCVDEIVTVSEESIREAVARLLWRDRLVVEPSGAVTLAAVLEGKLAADKTVLVLSGGNIAPDLLVGIAARPVSG